MKVTGKRIAFGAAGGLVGAAVATILGCIGIAAVLSVDGALWTAEDMATISEALIGGIGSSSIFTLPIGALVGSVTSVCLGHRFTTRTGSLASMVIGAISVTMFAAMFIFTVWLNLAPALVVVALLSGALGGYVAWRVSRSMALRVHNRENGSVGDIIGK